ncbi:MAG: serine/threonine-protein kinase, partial [Myxococcota bacterium]
MSRTGDDVSDEVARRLARAQIKAQGELAQLDAAQRAEPRYVLDHPLGQGGQAQTFLAKDQATGERVVIKRLLLAHLDDWKAIELFEREGEVLEHLEHASIPRYVDAMHVHAEAGDAFYLVQQYVEGPTLAEEIARGRRFSEGEIEALARELLGVLAYLHALHPPVIHRDLKPSNIICRVDGGYALIDFGAIQVVLPRESRLGSTIVGTSGYMAPEQFMGRSVPATDLYALGATLTHAMSRVHPNEMSLVRMKLDVRPHLSASEELVQWVERLLEPAVEDRFASATEAMAGLDELHQRRDAGLPVPVERVGPEAEGEAQLEQPSFAGPSSAVFSLVVLIAVVGITVGVFSATKDSSDDGIVIRSATTPLPSEPSDVEGRRRGIFEEEREATTALLTGAEVIFRMPAGQAKDLDCNLYRYSEYTGGARVGLECTNTSQEAIVQLKVDVRLEEEDGSAVVGKSKEPVRAMIAPMLPGDTFHEYIDLGDIKDRAEIARLVVDVVQCEKAQARERLDGEPVELTWMVAKPEGADIEVRIRSEERERGYKPGEYEHRIVGELEHRGSAQIEEVHLEKRVYDAGGRLVASEHSWAHGPSGPPLLRGQVKAFSIWTMNHAKPA